MRKLKCKHCWTYTDKETIVKNNTYNYCSKKCRQEHWWEVVRKAKDKQKARQVKIKEKKANSVSTLTKKADKLWSEAVKIEYNYGCQYCWKKEYLNSHHLYTRSRRATRWDIDNWICLCSWCHTLSSNFSAHQTPLEFFEWLEWIRGRDWIDRLSKKSRQTIKYTPEMLKIEIENLQHYIKQNANT